MDLCGHVDRQLLKGKENLGREDRCCNEIEDRIVGRVRCKPKSSGQGKECFELTSEHI